MNAYHSRERALKVNTFTKSVKSIHYYDSIVVLEKGKIKEPFTENSGALSFDDKSVPTPWTKKIAAAPLKLVNAISGLFRWRHLD